MAMAAIHDQQTWVPYVPTKDCSMGFCSIYCPQWCYIIFPPPPPVEFSDDNSGLTLSPLVIAIIGVIAGAFVLVCYYTIVSKRCGSFDSLRRWLHHPGAEHRELDESIVGHSHRRESWNASPSHGLDEALIRKIMVHKYRRGDALVQGTDCSVCLSEFREDDALRLLPKCGHAFHLQCIDTWLRSHSNCPLCRANIALLNPASPPRPARLPPAPAPENSVVVEEIPRANETVLVVEDDVISTEEEMDSESSSSNDAAKETNMEMDAIVEIRDDDELQPCGRVSIADVLRMSIEEELIAAKESGVWVGTSSSRRVPGADHRRHRVLHGVMSTVPMKRSISNGRCCLTRHLKGRNGFPVQEASE
ncbi:hypothetical protein Cni_G25455 [Canna indica]|uniref:RING-type E3 ubiquitin transferase n=1 Tax=Canna indica TaxID=4628 RepID=A0AAQ3L4D4_9LILI|nr:hypothetical protein Cni_G25455 [Canna indica]